MKFNVHNHFQSYGKNNNHLLIIGIGSIELVTKGYQEPIQHLPPSLHCQEKGSDRERERERERERGGGREGGREDEGGRGRG